MTTLAELTVELDVDGSGVGSGLNRAEKKFKASMDRMQGMTSMVRFKPQLLLATAGAAFMFLPQIAAVAASGMAVAFAGGLVGVGMASAAKSEEVKRHWTGLKEHVVSEMAKLSAPLQDTLVGIAGNARGVFDSLSPSIGRLYSDNAPKITELGNTLETAFSGWDGVIDGASDVFGEFLTALNDPEFQTALDDLKVALETLFNSTDGADFASFLTTLVDLMTKFVNAMTFVQEHPKLFQFLGVMILVVAAAFIVLAVALWAVNSALLANPVTWMILAIVIIIILLIAIIASLIIWWDEFKAGLIIIWTAIWNKIKEVWGKIVNAFNTAKATVLNIWNSIWNTIKSVFNTVKTWITEKITTIKDNIVLGFTTVKDKAVEIFNNIKDTIEEKIDSIVNFVKGLPQKIKDVFSGAGSWLWDAGKKIIDGLLNGLKSMWNTVKGWFGNLTDIIPDWKGPMRVDMKLLEPAGEAIMAGLNVGIDDGWGDTRKNLRGITNAIGESVQVDAERGAGRYTGASATNVTVRIDGLGRGKLAEAIRESVRIDGGGNVQNAFGGRS